MTELQRGTFFSVKPQKNEFCVFFGQKTNYLLTPTGNFLSPKNYTYSGEGLKIMVDNYKTHFLCFHTKKRCSEVFQYEDARQMENAGEEFLYNPLSFGTCKYLLSQCQQVI